MSTGTGKDLLARMVAILTKMIGRAGEVRQGNAVYAYVNEYEYDGEQDHEHAAAER